MTAEDNSHHLGVSLNWRTYTVRRKDRTVDAHRVEMLVLEGILAAGPGIAAREDVRKHVYGTRITHSNTLTVQVCRLRDVIAPLGLRIVTIKNTGFQLVADDASEQENG